MRAKSSRRNRPFSALLFFVAFVFLIGLFLSVYRFNRIKILLIKRASPTERPDHSSAAMQPSSTSDVVVFHGVYIEGSEISSSKVASDEECKQLCKGHLACNAFSVCLSTKKCENPSKLGLCTLKRIDDVTRLQLDASGPDVGWTSGVFPPSLSHLHDLFRARGLSLVPTETLILGLHNATGTIEVISPRSNPFFNFALPHDNFARKSNKPGHHHLGDLSFHARRTSSEGSQYSRYSTVADRGRWNEGLKRAPSSIAMATDGHRQIYADLTDQTFLHRGPDLTKSLRVERWLETSEDNEYPWIMPGEARMMFQLTNIGDDSIEIGAVGISMVMDQFFVNRKLEQVAVQCSFVEAYVGGGFGYIQVTRANGEGPTLLILPTPGTSFEAWRPLRSDDRTEGVGFGFEGHHEILIHSKSWAEDEWHGVKQWVDPTSKTLAKSEHYTFGFKVVLAPGPTEVEATLTRAGHPVIIGVPGFVLHHDMEESKVIVQLPEASKGGSIEIASIVVDPPSALEVRPVQPLLPSHLQTSFHSRTFNWHYQIRGLSRSLNGTSWSNCESDSIVIPIDCRGYLGRVRLKFSFRFKGHADPPISSPREQIVQLLLLPPARDQVSAYGQSSSDPNRGWLAADSNDPWQRGPSFMGIDNEAGGKKGPIKLMAEPRVFMSGLSDEAGAAQPLAMAIKQTVMPVQDEIDKLESYAHEVLGPADETKHHGIQSPLNFSVRASLFYYDPNNSQTRAFEKAQPAFMKGCAASAWWLTCWSKSRASETWRAYNYPHVAAVYWSLYRVSRFQIPSPTRRAEWDYYLRRAAKTALAMYEFGPGYGR